MNGVSLSRRYRMRSRAVSFFFSCCFSIAAFPPPSAILSSRVFSWLIARRIESSFLLKSRVSGIIVNYYGCNLTWMQKYFGLFLAAMRRQRKITWMVLIMLAASIKILSFYPTVVERYYSKGVYPELARLQRILFGWIPFSIGDVLYLAAIVLLIWRLVRLIRVLIRRKAEKGWFLLFLRRTLFVVLW